MSNTDIFVRYEKSIFTYLLTPDWVGSFWRIVQFFTFWPYAFDINLIYRTKNEIFFELSTLNTST